MQGTLSSEIKRTAFTILCGGMAIVLSVGLSLTMIAAETVFYGRVLWLIFGGCLVIGYSTKIIQGLMERDRSPRLRGAQANADPEYARWFIPTSFALLIAAYTVAISMDTQSKEWSLYGSADWTCLSILAAIAASVITWHIRSKRYPVTALLSPASQWLNFTVVPTVAFVATIGLRTFLAIPEYAKGSALLVFMLFLLSSAIVLLLSCLSALEHRHFRDYSLVCVHTAGFDWETGQSLQMAEYRSTTGRIQSRPYGPEKRVNPAHPVWPLGAKPDFSILIAVKQGSKSYRKI